MTTTLTTPEAFRAYLDANPHDFVAMGSYADRLDEEEKESVLTNGPWAQKG